MATSKKLALIGYGKMGRLIAQLAPDHGFEVALHLSGQDNAAGQGISAAAFSGIDVAIEFSTPEAAPSNLRRLAELKIPTVTGTTGWLDHLAYITEIVEKAGTGLVWSPNFSIGIAVFNRLATLAAELFSHEEAYGAWAWEIHHSGKKDAPSGTLLHLVKVMKDAGYSRPIDLSSNRTGRHPGTHEIGFDSQSETVTLRHVARSREGFAEGALKSASWILNHKGVYTFENVLFGFVSQN